MSHAGERGVTLIDTIVGAALLTLVFVGIAGAFQLSIDIVTNNKARAGAIALANERMEYIRSLSYSAIGTVGGIPAGSIAQTEQVELNGITYTRRTIVLYGDDPGDGAGAADENDNPADYKAVKVEVAWTARHGALRSVVLTTRASPPGIEQAVPGGTLALSILNSAAAPVTGAVVTIQNSSVNPPINMSLLSDENGVVTVIGATAGAGYRITVTKPGYSYAQTYDATAENTNPTPGHLTVAEDQTTSAPFFVDLFAEKTVSTHTPIESATTSDSFNNGSQVAENPGVEVSGGVAKLLGSAPYSPSGTMRSVTIAPEDLYEWKRFSWSDAQPGGTSIRYRVYDPSDATPLPDYVLSGNSTGFVASPVDISGISTTTYPSLALHATLETADENATPEALSWDISYNTGSVPIPDVEFSLRGAKTVGSGPGGLVYRLDEIYDTGASGTWELGNMEYDTYEITVGSATGYDVASSCSPQPESLSAGETEYTRLFLAPHTAHSLLVDVKVGGAYMSNVPVRLYRGAYNKTITTDACGQAFFSSLDEGTQGDGDPYSIEVSPSGSTPYTASDVDVSGTSRLSVALN